MTAGFTARPTSRITPPQLGRSAGAGGALPASGTVRPRCARPRTLTGRSDLVGARCMGPARPIGDAADPREDDHALEHRVSKGLPRQAPPWTKDPVRDEERRIAGVPHQPHLTNKASSPRQPGAGSNHLVLSTIICPRGHGPRTSRRLPEPRRDCAQPEPSGPPTGLNFALAPRLAGGETRVDRI